jgi:hypothetical protein
MAQSGRIECHEEADGVLGGIAKIERQLPFSNCDTTAREFR